MNNREYLIKSDGVGQEWGKLYYDEEKGAFRLCFREDIDIKKDQPPAYVRLFLQGGKNEISGDLALLWVRDRIIPKERQNIAEILNRAGLTVYREVDMLELTNGRCTRDNLYLERIK